MPHMLSILFNMHSGAPPINHPCTLCCRPTPMWCSHCQNTCYCSPEHIHSVSAPFSVNSFSSELEQSLRNGPDTGASACPPKVLQFRMMSTGLQHHPLQNHNSLPCLQMYSLPRMLSRVQTRLVSVPLDSHCLFAASYHSRTQMVECPLLLNPLLPIPL